VQETACVGDLLAVVLPSAGGAACPPWDERREYTAANCDVFYRSNVSAPLDGSVKAWSWARPGSVGGTSGAADGDDGSGSGDRRAPPVPKPSGQPQRWVRVPPGTPLATALAQPNHVIPDIPVLYVIARSSRFHAALREKLPGGLFAELPAQ
jgi:hypothetical protein